MKSYPKSYPINDENSSIRQHIQGNKKALKPLWFKALCILQDTAENRVWWRRGESNPRPKVLYRAFYILSCVYLESRPHHADQQAFREPVTLNLVSCQVTRQKTSQCRMTLR